MASYIQVPTQTPGSPEKVGLKPNVEIIARDLPQDLETEQPVSHAKSQWRRLYMKIREKGRNGWSWDLLAWVTSISLDCFIVFIASLFNHEPVSSFHLPWSMNSMIAFLVTLMKGSMMVPVGSALGQWRWARFKNWHKLVDMDIIDEASRGVIGSIKLLFKFRQRRLPPVHCLGAVITILAFFLDAVAQNVVDTQLSWVVNGSASYPATDRYTLYNTAYNRESNERKIGDQFATVEMIGAVSYGVSTRTNVLAASLSQTIFKCPTGNCTFPGRSSLSLKADCKDTSSVIDASDKYFFRSRDGLVLHRELGMVNSSTTAAYPKDGLWNETVPLLVHISIIGNPDPGNSTPTAMECLLFWVVSVVSPEVQNGQLVLHDQGKWYWTNSSNSARTTYNQTIEIILAPPDYLEPIDDSYSYYLTNDGSKRFWVDPRAQLGLQNYLMDPRIGLTGTVEQSSEGVWKSSTSFMMAIGTAFWRAKVGLRNISEELPSIFKNIESAINQVVSTSTKGLDDSSTSWTVGIAWEQKQHFKFNYRWLVPIHILLVISGFLFIFADGFCRNNAPWKTSSLPLLYHGLSMESRIRLPEAPKYLDMESSAKEVEAKLTDTEEGLRLVTRVTNNERAMWNSC